MQDLKIVLVIDQITNPHAGTEGQFLLLIHQLQQFGVKVQVMVLSPSTWLAKNALPCDYDVLGSSSIKRPSTWLGVFKLGRKYRKQGFKLAHVFFNDASVVCPPMFYAAGLKTIISRRDMGFWYTPFYKFILPITGRFVDKVVSNSRAVSEITGQVERIPAERLLVIYNGYDRAPEIFSTVDVLESLKQTGALILGIVANVRPIKRMQDAIAALAALGNKAGNAHLVIIGAGDSSELATQAASLGIAERVHFLGSRSDIPDCLQYFSAGLLCSESEGFSNAIVEYQFAGLPVICTRTGGNPEAVNHGETGWLYPVGDVNELAQCIQQLLADIPRAVAMGALAKAQANERYSVEKMRDNYLSVYQKTLDC